jgi:hypothetical protein
MHEHTLDRLLDQYQRAFVEVELPDENEDADLLMEVFGISPEQKRDRRQYWGRHLGTLWESMIMSALVNHPRYANPIERGRDRPCDFILGDFAIDTKYRIGSGDSGTIKKFRRDGAWLASRGFEPVMLILREDSLEAAVSACRRGGWAVHTGEQVFDFLARHGNIDLRAYLLSRQGARIIDQ